MRFMLMFQRSNSSPKLHATTSSLARELPLQPGRPAGLLSPVSFRPAGQSAGSAAARAKARRRPQGLVLNWRLEISGRRKGLARRRAAGPPGPEAGQSGHLAAL